MTRQKQKVVVGMSGGVDSSIAATLLLRKGFDVYGIFLENWTQKNEYGICSSELDRQDAAKIAGKLGIPFKVLNYEKEYKDKILSYMIQEYDEGKTPNPDILCNPLIKFKALIHAADKIGAKNIATGHYARKLKKNNNYYLLCAFDKEKDQSYFLSRLSQEQLARVIFPVGHLKKTEVRRMAKNYGFDNWNKESTKGICFISPHKMADFLSDKVKAIPGPIVTENGEYIGTHKGLPYYTIGQRRGFSRGNSSIYYVARKESENNTLIVAPAYSSLHLRSVISASHPHWLTHKPTFPLKCQARIRYRQPPQACLIEKNGSKLRIKFNQPQRSVTPGQFVVFYKNKVCLGSAIID